MLYELVTSRLDQIHIRPNEQLGQHFLVDKTSIDSLVEIVELGSLVIEVGPGVGQLTERLAEKASKVISVEIDERYKPILSGITREHRNIQVIYGDAISLDWRNLIKDNKAGTNGTQIVASLPYHITEPFLHKIAVLPIQDATLVVGNRLGRAVQAVDESDPEFSQRTLLVQTFFDAEILGEIKKQDFFPVPRTDSVIIRLTPKQEDYFKDSKRDYILRRLFLTSSHSPLVKNCIKEALIQFDGASLTQNQARGIIASFGIAESVLNKSFEQLNNTELGILSRSLRSL